MSRPIARPAPWEQSPPPRPDGPPADRTSGTLLHSGSKSGSQSGLSAAGQKLAAALFPLVQLIVRAVARVSFGRIETLDRQRFPRRGPVLVIANHPATWTDVVVLEAALGRRLHFMAHQPLFRPWIRALLLELFGALPVWYRHEEPQSIARNKETFARCHALFGEGEAVAVFPEGVSGGDRDLLPLKTGTARMLLGSDGIDPRPVLLPIAILYDDRTAFRTPVTVAVGAPIAFEMFRSQTGGTHETIHALTDKMARALASTLQLAEAHANAERSAGGGGRARGAGRRLLDAPGRALAAAGMLLHATPRWAIERIARAFVDQPQRFAFARMVAGLVLIPLWYALLAALAAALGGGAWFALPLSAPLLGALACREYDRRLRAAGSRDQT